jgi:hypothetical protein
MKGARSKRIGDSVLVASMLIGQAAIYQHAKGAKRLAAAAVRLSPASSFPT